MILAGTNYLLIYSALLGKFKKLFTNTEFIWYLTVISIFVIVTSFVLFINVDLSTSNVNHPEIYGRLESSFRHAFFMSLIMICLRIMANAVATPKMSSYT